MCGEGRVSGFKICMVYRQPKKMHPRSTEGQSHRIFSRMKNCGWHRSTYLVRLRTAMDGDDRYWMNCRKSETTRVRCVFGDFFRNKKVTRRRNRGPSKPGLIDSTAIINVKVFSNSPRGLMSGILGSWIETDQTRRRT